MEIMFVEVKPDITRNEVLVDSRTIITVPSRSAALTYAKHLAPRELEDVRKELERTFDVGLEIVFK